MSVEIFIHDCPPAQGAGASEEQIAVAARSAKQLIKYERATGPVVVVAQGDEGDGFQLLGIQAAAPSSTEAVGAATPPLPPVPKLPQVGRSLVAMHFKYSILIRWGFQLLCFLAGAVLSRIHSDTLGNLCS